MNLLIAFLSADISVAFSLSVLVITVLLLSVVMQLAQKELLNVNNDLLKTMDAMEDVIFSLHCDISDMAHDEMANRHYHDIDILKLQDEIKELKLQLEDAKLVASYVPNYYKPMTEEEMSELREMEL